MQLSCSINQRKLFNAPHPEDLQGLLSGRVRGAGGQFFAWRHHLPHRSGFVLDIPHVTAGHHAHEHAAIGHDGEPAHSTLAHQPRHFTQRGFGAHRQRVDDHRVLRTLHARDLLGLIVNRACTVNHPHAAFTRECDGEFALRDRIHRGRQHGNVQPQLRSELCAKLYFTGKHGASARQQQHIIERQRQRWSAHRLQNT